MIPRKFTSRRRGFKPPSCHRNQIGDWFKLVIYTDSYGRTKLRVFRYEGRGVGEGYKNSQ